MTTRISRPRGWSLDTVACTALQSHEETGITTPEAVELLGVLPHIWGVNPTTSSLRRLAVAAILLLTASVARAQPAARDSPWSGSVQANGSAYFGNSNQRLFGGRSALSRSDSLLQLEARAEFVYGDAEINSPDRQVVKRTLLGTLTADYRPKGMLSPFVSVTVESNLEKKIDTRYSVGVGAKQTFIRTKQTETSLSVALLDELTVPLVAADADPLPSTRLTRWSLRGRLNHTFDDRLRMTHATFWQPSAWAGESYLVRSTSEAEYAITRHLGFATSMVVNYDSEAILRGARVNHDGQVLFGVTARW
jgi:hypothetical protein